MGSGTYHCIDVPQDHIPTVSFPFGNCLCIRITTVRTHPHSSYPCTGQSRYISRSRSPDCFGRRYEPQLMHYISIFILDPPGSYCFCYMIVPSFPQLLYLAHTTTDTHFLVLLQLLTVAYISLVYLAGPDSTIDQNTVLYPYA